MGEQKPVPRDAAGSRVTGSPVIPSMDKVQVVEKVN